MRTQLKGMKLKVVAAAVALAVSGASHATFTADMDADSSLVFAAWNGTTSYIENLTATNAADTASLWIATNGTPASASFQLNSLFSSTFTSGTGLNWAVFGGTGPSGPANPGTNILVTTGDATTTASTVGNIGSALGSINSWFSTLNTTPVGTNDYGTIALTDPNSPAVLAPGYNGFILGTTYMTGYGYMEFVSLADLNTPVLLHDNPTKGFTLAANGALTYGPAAVSEVPIPAAAWLFGSGLLGLIGIGRRKPS